MSQRCRLGCWPGGWLLVLPLALGCASTVAVAPAPGVGRTDAAVPLEELWGVSSEELWTQRLYRMHYDGPEGEGSFKLTMRLASPELFQMSTVDRLSRRWWGLAVEGEEALLLDHRSKTYCRYLGEIEITAVPLGPLPFKTLPALLLGRLPLEAAGTSVRDGNDLSFEDRRGRRWTATLVGEATVSTWTLWDDEEPQVWWQARGRAALLSARREGLQLRWRQVVRETMAPPLSQMSIPEEYAPGDCG